MHYTFNTKSVFLLGKALSHFKDEVDEIVGLLPVLAKVGQGEDLFDHVDADRLMNIVTNVLTKSSDAEELAMQFLANASRMTVAQISELDGYTFLSELKNSLMAIDWNRLLKESIGLTLTPPSLSKDESKPSPMNPLTPASAEQS